MTYLYGDSTDSGLELNYIELLREFLDFAVQVILSEQRIAGGRLTADEANEKTEAELGRLRALGASVNATLAKAKSTNPRSAADQSAVAIGQATKDILQRAAQALKQSTTQHEQKLQSTKLHEHANSAKLIEPLLRNHHLPDSKNLVNVELDAEGQSYAAEVLGSCEQGLAWRFVASIPSGHLFKETIKVSSIDADIVISLPEKSGFVRKSVKLKPYRLYPLYVTSVKHVGSDIVVKFRSMPSSSDDTGLDISIAPGSPRVSITRLQKGEESPPFDAPGDDATKLKKLVQNLSQRMQDLVEERSKLIEVNFDNQPLANCGEPTILVTRLIQRLGPVISKIAEKSLAENELVLKQVLKNGRREEIFASKTDMLDRIAAVPIGARWVFSPLGLGELGAEPGDQDPTNQIDTIALKERAAELNRPFNEEDSIDEQEETKIQGEPASEPASEPTDEEEVSEIIALAADEEDEELTELVAIVPTIAPRPPLAKTLQSKVPPMKVAPKAGMPNVVPARIPPVPAPPIIPVGRTRVSGSVPVPIHPPPPTPVAPMGDSIDVALAELEAES